MGTNFYMMTKSKKLVEKYFPYEYEISVGGVFEKDCNKLEKWDCYGQAKPNMKIITREVIRQYKEQKKEKDV